MGWQWHQLNHLQIMCTLLQTDNHASTSSGQMPFLTSNQRCQNVKTLKVSWPCKRQKGQLLADFLVGLPCVIHLEISPCLPELMPVSTCVPLHIQHTAVWIFTDTVVVQVKQSFSGVCVCVLCINCSQLWLRYLACWFTLTLSRSSSRIF